MMSRVILSPLTSSTATETAPTGANSMDDRPSAPRSTNRAADFLALTKPTITFQCAVIAGLGVWLAPGSIGWLGSVAAVAGSSLAVASANALNMWLERDSDGLMARTKNRPLPGGRLSAHSAVAFGVILGVASLLVLGLWTTPLATAVGAAALVTYVGIYTPLKRRTPLALLIGAFPGAAPILMGWTAVTGAADAPALVLFATMLIWQMPHFLAISLYRKAEYARAGIRVVPVVRGDQIAKAQTIAYSTALVPVSLLLLPLGAAGWIYAAVALLCGLWILGLSVRGLWAPRTARWARELFIATLVYVPALAVALVVDGWLR